MSFRYVSSAGAGVLDDLSVPIGSDVTEQYSCVCDPRLSSIAQRRKRRWAWRLQCLPFESKVCS